ncbi:uncharacterized protein C1450.15 [Argentina anserina]|uniref:uncharacterized protein C1450.15 n=1 Tax=Argentina anserina TaxID=57926 RepID=UPI0021763E59|nr:uncharacterized protein C1450.15 [Potentilla anserina]
MKQKKNKMGARASSISVSTSEALLVLLTIGLGLALCFSVAHNVHFISLTSHPSQVLGLIWAFQCPTVILLYSRYRKDPERCSYWKAVGRGVLGLPAGAVVNALGAIALGAPVGIQYLPKTINWSLMMSLFTIVPAASVFGSSWTDWQRLFACTKPNDPVDYMICLPAHGVVIGAWLGAWPVPLDWERPWQEWPICVSYGAIAGYLVSLVASFGFILVRQHVKGD